RSTSRHVLTEPPTGDPELSYPGARRECWLRLAIRAQQLCECGIDGVERADATTPVWRIRTCHGWPDRRLIPGKRRARCSSRRQRLGLGDRHRAATRKARVSPPTLRRRTT